MSEVTDSILFSVKKLNSVAQTDTSFDDDFILWINDSLAVLNQLGIGPSEGFFIEDENSSWEDFFGTSPLYNMVQSYVARRVKLHFDPPNNGFAITMIEKQLDEAAWRIVVMQQDIEAAEEVV